MTIPITNRDIQRVTFVESLYNSLKKQTAKAISEHDKFLKLAKSYVGDGLEESECIELLMIDGLSRDSAEGYTALAFSSTEPEEDSNLNTYAFQFDDIYGKRWSSYDIGKTIKASNDDEAWEKAEELISQDRGVESGIEADKLISINRIS